MSLLLVVYVLNSVMNKYFTRRNCHMILKIENARKTRMLGKTPGIFLTEVSLMVMENDIIHFVQGSDGQLTKKF